MTTKMSTQDDLASALANTAVPQALIDVYDDGTVAVEIGHRTYVEATPVGRNKWDLAIRGYGRDNGMDFEREISPRSLSHNGVLRMVRNIITASQEDGEW
jgi:hypothetical protein